MTEAQKYNFPLIVLIVIVVIILFASFIFNVMTAFDIKDSSCSSERKASEAHKLAWWSAIINVISAVLTILALVYYFIIYREQFWKEITTTFQKETKKITSKSNTLLIILLIIGIVLLFISMVLNAISASDISSSSCSLEKDARNAHKWSTISAILNAFAVIILGFALGSYIYINRSEYKKSITDKKEKILVGLRGEYPTWETKNIPTTTFRTRSERAIRENKVEAVKKAKVETVKEAKIKAEVKVEKAKEAVKEAKAAVKNVKTQNPFEKPYTVSFQTQTKTQNPFDKPYPISFQTQTKTQNPFDKPYPISFSQSQLDKIIPPLTSTTPISSTKRPKYQKAI